jgi:hypothetical protein
MPFRATSSDAFAITYDSDLRQLHGRWAGPVAEADLYAHYAELVAAAETHGNCRFWLLDLRARNWHTPRFSRWYANEFSALVCAAVGQPLYIAYLVSPTHAAAANSLLTQVMQGNSAAHGLHPYYTDQEAAAREWLLHKQVLDPQEQARRRAATPQPGPWQGLGRGR